MTEMPWTACYTDPGVERKVQSEIEKLDIGTFIPTFAKTWLYAGGKSRAVEHPILARYVLIAVPCGGVDGVFGIEGVQGVLGGRISEQEILRLMLAHATGAYNETRARTASGRFSSTIPPKPRRKHKKRRRRPRHGKRLGNPTHIASVLSHDTHREFAAGA